MNKYNILAIGILLLFIQVPIQAQAPAKWTSADIHQKIKKLNVLGSVLYVAAHPDDENTRFISFMANEKKAETAYLSLTRGDGGQNLIGTEIRDLLGVLRTQELMSARKIDGGNQFFTRANDFGYSKHPDETFDIWNKEEVFSDVIMTIRKFQPDIIVNRFNHRTPGTTHGHHTGSAMLGLEAFNKSGDKNIYPEQLSLYPAYKAERIFFNTSWWFYGSKEKFEKADKTNLFTEDIGVFYPLKGKSNSEIATESRSEHRCQGMGRSTYRGGETEHLELLDGSRPELKNDIFSGINTTWTRLKGGEKIGKIITGVDKNFDHSAPYKSTDQLILAYTAIQKLEEGIWKDRKLKEIKDIIVACSGLYLDVNSSNRTLAPGDQATLNLEAINRSPINWTLNGISSSTTGVDTSFVGKLFYNNNISFEKGFSIPEDSDYSAAYWLREKGTLGMYKVKDKSLIGLPQSPDPIEVTFHLSVNGSDLSITRPLVYKTSDPVKGEVYDPFEILPPVFSESKEETVIFKPGQKRTVRVEVTAGKKNLKGTLIPCFDKAWNITPAKIDFELASKDEKAYFDIEVTAPIQQSVSKISYIVEVDGKSYTDKLVKIEYGHIPTQLVLQGNEINAICIDIKSVGNRVAYIMGAGDKVPEALNAIGYQVDIIEEESIRAEVLEKYQAVIVGIRAYNVMDNMKFHHKILMEYVNNGGTVVSQYNTRHRLNADNVGPYPIKLSRKRVTDEYAPVKILAKDHPIMNYPNKITEKDFEGWVQERGLYFPEEWDEAYTALISSSDKGEDPLTGGLLVAEYGEGHFVYTGYSFFRELPAGVPGAYRLFANLISYGQENQP